MSFDNIKLDKGLYTTGKSFTASLEELDPSENYKGTSLDGLDAFERQLKRFDIKVSGEGSDTISKFFATTDSAVLFPEYISRVVNYGVQEDNKADRIIATTTSIDCLDYRSIESDNKVEDFFIEETNEGAAMSECTIKLKDNLTRLKKYGKLICASYEAIKFQKLDLFSVTLRKIGEAISELEFSLALQTILNAADGSEEFPVEFTYNDLIDLWISLNPYHLTTLVVGKQSAARLLKMPEFRDANAGLDFHSTGKLIAPFGAEIIIEPLIESGGIIALDNRYALERVQAGGVVTEFDKLIDRQIERAAVSKTVGFSPIFKDAVALFNLD